MVGLCASVDSSLSIRNDLYPYYRFFGNESVYRFDFERTNIACVAHDDSNVQHVTAPDTDILLFGQFHTIRKNGEHKRLDAKNIKSIIRSLYKKFGSEFVSKINGEFVAIIETEGEPIQVATDRLSKKPLFITSIEDGHAISTNLLSLISELDRSFSLDKAALQEYFTFNRVFGTQTPIQEILQVPPASITTVESTAEHQTYWYPEYTPKQWDSQNLIERIGKIIHSILDEQLSGDESYGLLLSGGSDSRMFLSQVDDYDVTAFTLGDWWNKEVNIAYRAATIADVPFRFLRRDKDYHETVLDKSPRMCDFVSRFDQAHALGFVDQLQEDVDVLINGMFADTFFKGHFLPVISFDTPAGEFDPPVEKQISNLDSYISHLSEQSPPKYIRSEVDTVDNIKPMIEQSDQEVQHHGVKYSDLQHTIASGSYYPLTNQKDLLLYQSLNHMLPTITPFLDDRLIDLHLSIPTSMQLRGNLINRVVEYLSEDLAEVPHSGTNVSLSSSFVDQFIGYNITRLWRNLRSPSGKPWYSNDPWPDQSELIRETDFVSATLIEKHNILNDLDIIDAKSAHQVYDSHISGSDNWEDLYTLITVLNMPGMENL